MELAVTPTQRIVAEAAQEFPVTDSEGRVLMVRRPGPLERLRLFKLVGPMAAGNAQYVGYAMLAMCVSAIDDVPVVAPATEGQLEALVSKLGDAGMNAVSQGVADAALGNR